jgi:hypothetical protein
LTTRLREPGAPLGIRRPGSAISREEKKKTENHIPIVTTLIGAENGWPTSSHFLHFTSYPLVQCIGTTIRTSLKYHVIPFLYGWRISPRNNPQDLAIALRQLQHNNLALPGSKDTLGFGPGFRPASKVLLILPNDTVTPTTHRQEHIL